MEEKPILKINTKKLACLLDRSIDTATCVFFNPDEKQWVRVYPEEMSFEAFPSSASKLVKSLVKEL